MSQSAVTLALRFLLEIAALAAVGYWGWTQHSGVARWVWTIGLPFLAASLWGTFRTGEEAPVAIPGPLRLLLEVGVFSGAVALLAAAGRGNAALALGLALVVQYIMSYDYVVALMHNRPL